ncbi:MAG: hypothetical protein FWC15_02510 [Fibromonadales bacterium]|nr:hypothetical protein [Fibromonadales bacterium]
MAANICLGVEISQDDLKVALVDPKRKHIIKVDVVPTSGNPIGDASIYASVLGSWSRSNLLPQISATAVAFPACSGIMRLVPIPKEIESGFYDYVNWEFSHATNLKISDYQMDAAFYPNQKKPERVVVTAMSKKLMDTFGSEELDKGGFTPSCLIADICALLNLLEVSEKLGSQPKCVLKVDGKFAVVFWGNESGPLAIRLLPKDFISPKAIVEILDSGFNELPKAKRIVKLCGECSANTEFTSELANAVSELREPIEVQSWKSLSKFSLEKVGDFSKLSQCLGAIGATLSCA